ncbi:helix-turn-helix transcriptional regulator [Pedobacter antarcticus]|uniref:helix-turn-helix transcriptional regulator n=1 Tax=Pedobacter antarcticus TaxID=34086 RepID=UPI00088D024D|nr:WYL domain-containing protein [Pedobacter antarcticus]SDL84617.1 Predicted DNA-binding transcriptional regulator YafY, contains an HTH and WYL domains [Pedobacter antarcticus]
MATNKHAIIRYEALDRCFSNKGRKFFIEELISYVANMITEYTGSEASISRRQLFKDMDFMRSEAGFRAPIIAIKEGKKAYYKYEDPKYSIGMQQINPVEAELLKNAIEVLGRFKGIAQFDFIPELSLKLKKTFHLEDLENIIFFDYNEYLKNLDYLGQLLKAIQDKDVLNITYRSFNQDQEENFILHPFFLKQYNNRWFLFGQRSDYSSLTNLAIDRIISFSKSYHHEYQLFLVDPEEYFEDLIGVSKPIGAQAQLIQIKINKSLWPYIESKPIHSSQKIIAKEANYAVIQLDIIPNYEFYALLLGLGSAVEILNPKAIRLEFKAQLTSSLDNYTP